MDFSNYNDSSEWRLSHDDIRKNKRFENISDEEADIIIDTLVFLDQDIIESKEV